MAKLKDSHPDLYIGFTEKPNVLDDFLSVLRKLLDYCLCCLTCGCYPGNGNGFHGDAFETDLTDEERIVVKNLLKYLDSSHTGKGMYSKTFLMFRSFEIFKIAIHCCAEARMRLAEIIVIL